MIGYSKKRKTHQLKALIMPVRTIDEQKNYI